jgi:hypothetical protein
MIYRRGAFPLPYGLFTAGRVADRTQVSVPISNTEHIRKEPGSNLGRVNGYHDGGSSCNSSVVADEC